MKSYDEVYQLVRKIPKGKVTTYGAIGKALNISPRHVGYILHVNPDGEKTPCHRVVNRDGRVASGYAFGGAGKQKELLEKERVAFIDREHVKLSSHLYHFSDTKTQQRTT